MGLVLGDPTCWTVFLSKDVCMKVTVLDVLLLAWGFGDFVVVVAAAVRFVLSFVFIFGFGLVLGFANSTQARAIWEDLISIISPVGKSMGHFHD